MNEYFQPGSNPATSSPGSSAVIRAQFANIAAGFDKLPIMAGNAGEIVTINATGTALIASGFVFGDIATLDGIQTLTNKTLSWADNTWVGFGTGATKDAGTLAGEVLLLAEDNKLPAMDAGNLTNIPGLAAKADANNAVLTGAPTTSTPIPGDNSSRIANTLFVNQAVVAAGGAVPSANSPLMNGVANAGVGVQVSRDDHVHPSDTSRAPSSAATAAGTSFTPAGTVAATDVQAAIAELDTEKAPLASPIFTGDPRAPTTPTSDNDTSLATTSFVHALLAQQPPGVSVSNAIPLMDGVAAAGTGVAASRDDHVHPTDTSRAPTAGPSFSGTLTHSGDVVLSGSGKRITGDFSNATTANRLMFQSSAVNGATDVGVVPNGTSTTAGFTAYNAADPTNASTTTLQTTSTQSKLIAGKAGSGSYKPLVLNVNGVDAFQLDTSGNSLHTNPAGGLGYGAGAGGKVTQTTSKSTAVTLNRPNGLITTNNEALGANTAALFIVYNSLIAATDQVLFSIVIGATYGAYLVQTADVQTGLAVCHLRNVSAVSLSDSVGIRMTLIKGVNA